MKCPTPPCTPCLCNIQRVPLIETCSLPLLIRSDDVLKKLFRVFDVNSDGSISIKEMQRLVKDLYGLLKHSDPNQASKELIAKTAFSEMDQDNDGLVSMDEFVRAVLGQEQFSKMLTMNIMSIFMDEEQ